MNVISIAHNRPDLIPWQAEAFRKLGHRFSVVTNDRTGAIADACRRAGAPCRHVELQYQGIDHRASFCAIKAAWETAPAELTMIVESDVFPVGTLDVSLAGKRGIACTWYGLNRPAARASHYPNAVMVDLSAVGRGDIDWDWKRVVYSGLRNQCEAAGIDVIDWPCVPTADHARTGKIGRAHV